MTNKETRLIVKALESQGFTVKHTSKNHLQVRNAKGEVIAVIAGTPSDHRSWRNALARLKRAGFIWPPKL